MSCPACGAALIPVGIVPAKDFDGSIFTFDGDFRHCPACGFVRVETGLSDREISRHYAEVSLYAALSGVGVGGDSAQDRARYAQYLAFMRANGVSAGSHADIGCSRGGFVRYLAAQAPAIASTGVDCDARSLAVLATDGYGALEGDAFALPFADGEKDVLSYFHVLEHLYDVDSALAEAARVLKPGGALIVEVPDVLGYFQPETYVGPMFWLAMKEHVNHFTPRALRHFLRRNGFATVDVLHSRQPMKGDKQYPSLLLCARKEAAADTDAAVADGPDFPAVFRCDTAIMQRYAREIAADPSEPLCFWGIGLEFFALYGYAAPLLAGRQVRLLDRNQTKLGLTVDGRPVEAPEAAAGEGRLICCSYMAGPEIREQAMALGWQAESILCLS